MPWRFHIKNFRGRFHILIGLTNMRGPMWPTDYSRYTNTAFQLIFPIDFDYEFEQQAQYALSDIKDFLKSRG